MRTSTGYFPPRSHLRLRRIGLRGRDGEFSGLPRSSGHHPPHECAENAGTRPNPLPSLKFVPTALSLMWADRQDAQLILRLMLEDRLPQIWVASLENRDLRQLLWHRHRMVQPRMLTTRSGNWWCGDLHPTRFAALSAASAKLRLFANNAGSFGPCPYSLVWFRAGDAGPHSLQLHSCDGGHIRETNTEQK
jgi:hypothetical protein